MRTIQINSGGSRRYWALLRLLRFLKTLKAINWYSIEGHADGFITLKKHDD